MIILRTTAILLALSATLGCESTNAPAAANNASAGATTPDGATTTAPVPAGLLAEQAINATCPRSGKAVAANSLTQYRGYVVGFCNQHCRDDFNAHGTLRASDERAFDALIARLDKE